MTTAPEIAAALEYLDLDGHDRPGAVNELESTLEGLDCTDIAVRHTSYGSLITATLAERTIIASLHGDENSGWVAHLDVWHQELEELGSTR